jgi:hypothetical protein
MQVRQSPTVGRDVLPMEAAPAALGLRARVAPRQGIVSRLLFGMSTGPAAVWDAHAPTDAVDRPATARAAYVLCHTIGGKTLDPVLRRFVRFFMVAPDVTALTPKP